MILRAYYIFALIFSLIINKSNAQSLLIFEESKSDDNLINKQRIIDINSYLKVEVIDTIIKEKFSDDGITDSKFVSELRLFNQVVEIQKKINTSYDTTNNILFFTAYNNLMNIFRNNEFLNKYKVLIDILYEKRKKLIFPRQWDNSDFKAILIEFEKEFIKQRPIQKKLDDNQKLEVNIKAVMKSRGQLPRAITVKNYNNIEEGTVNPYEIWNSSFSKVEVDLAKKTAANANNNEKLLPSILNKAIDSLDVSALISNINSISLGSDNKVIELKKGISDDLLNLKNLARVDILKESTMSIKAEKLINDLSQKAIMLEQINENKILKVSQKELQNLMSKVRTTVYKLSDLNENVLIPTEALSYKANEINVTNYFHGLDNAPPGYIDLKTSGKRENFDELHIELNVTTKDSVQTIKELMVLQIVQVNWHLETNIGVILANSIQPNPKLALEREFQFAPNINFIFKRGSRKYPAVNFIQPGIGISISTPDFDLDASPDFSFGLVGTVFRDIISVGLSYNTAIDNTFWFLGLSLPFTGIGLPLGNVQNEASSVF